MITIRQPTPPDEYGFAVRFVLDNPVSVNALYVPVARGHMVLSKAGKEFKEAAGWEARAAMMQAGLDPTSYPVALQIEWQKPHGAGDLSNIVKALEDALIGIVYHDDRQIVQEHLWKDEGENPLIRMGVHVVVWEVGR